MANDAEKRPGPAFNNIKHFFVLMLENRSFDHLLGWHQRFQHRNRAIGKGTHKCPIDPLVPDGAFLPVTDDTPDMEVLDPPHEFEDVRWQVTGAPGKQYPSNIPQPMNGFAASAAHGTLYDNLATGSRGNGEYALRCCNGVSTPFLHQLAQQYVVCERWHSSMPGPTWPNRFFVHAGSSGGLDNSPSAWEVLKAYSLDRLGFDFEHKTIYHWLDRKRLEWRVYHGDQFPNVLAIKDMVRHRLFRKSRFRGIDRLFDDLNRGDKPSYVFIEPRYNVFSKHRNGTSQHPAGHLSAGDGLVKWVYESIRYSPIWEQSALIITYDEHGGFYDREPLPEAVPPGDAPLNYMKAKSPALFDFKLLGVRVPAIIVSPWIDPGVDGTVYDHASILRTAQLSFGLQGMTNRDRNAHHFAHLFARSTVRDDGIGSPPASVPEEAASPEDVARADFSSAEEEAGLDERIMLAFRRGNQGIPDGFEELSGDEAGVLRIARMVELIMKRQAAGFWRGTFDPLISALSEDAALSRAPRLTTRADARRYVAAIGERLSRVSEQISAGQA